MNRTAKEWAKVDADAVVSGSAAQARNVLKMALQDIAKLAAELETVQDHRARVGRNRDMWKAQCERQAEQLRENRETLECAKIKLSRYREQHPNSYIGGVAAEYDAVVSRINASRAMSQHQRGSENV